MRLYTFSRLLLMGLFLLCLPSRPVWAQKTRALVRVISGEVEKGAREGAGKSLPAVRSVYQARVLNTSKLQYQLEEIRKMMERDRTPSDKLLSGEVTPTEVALEQTLRKKVYTQMPSQIRPSEGRALSLVMLSSEETARRLAQNGGGKKFDIMSPEAACRTYQLRMQEFARIKKYIDTKLFYYQADGIAPRAIIPQERWDMMNQLSEIQVRIKFLLLYYFPEDLPLYLANKYLTVQMIKLEPVLGGLLEKLPVFVREDRVFNPREFVLQDPPAPAQVKPLPAGLSVAVVNDEEAITRGFANFGRWGNFGPGATVATFDNIYNLLATMQNGAKYDVIFTDISMMEGNGMLLVSKLRENGDNTPVIGSAGYRAEAAKPKDLFELGFDGYIVSDNNGYRRAPTALQNYFYYKKLHNWMR